MKKAAILFVCLLGCIITPAKGDNRVIPIIAHSTVFVSKITALTQNIEGSDTLKAAKKDTIKYRKKHRVIAALLALPPMGLFGLHRMYMHTAPIVPFVYIVTAGGLFGVLPFIDFVLVLLNKDIHLTYTSNPHLFMWQKR